MYQELFLLVIHTLRYLGTMDRIGQGMQKVLDRLSQGSECRYESAVGLALGTIAVAQKTVSGKNF